MPASVEGHHVTQGFHDFLEEDGYLVLKEGEFVFVEYIGFAGHEQGWLYGYKYDVANHHGWFPERCIKKRNSPLRPRPSPLPAGTPVPPKPPLLTTKVPDVDTFARTATPPPDDEELLERAVTPPPDDEDMSEPWLAPEPCARMPPQRRAPAPRQPPPPAPKGTPITELPPAGFSDRGPPASAEDCQSISEGLDVGRNLPMYQYCEELKRKVQNNRVVMVDAATGSGKSTLVPLCLAQQCLEENRGCRIVVTQPRRIAAKGLATRVSQQAGRPVGDLIGYRVGGHDKQDRPEGLIVYVTVGHFLEALVHNPAHLDSYSHIVLDEVHERFVEADFLMTLLRLSLSRPQTIGQRIIVMSATLQDALHRFFKPALLPTPHAAEMASITSPGSTPFVVEDFFFDDLPPHIKTLKKVSFGDLLPGNLKSLKATARSDKLTAACKQLTVIGAEWIRYLYEEKGVKVVLAFLPGLDQMKELRENLQSTAGRDRGREDELDIILMHSALDELDYRRALDPEEPGKWKVVIATNMAESSLTVPNVGAVVDFGMHRVNEYDDESKMSTLVTTWCSKASLKQRRGRTGRTCHGQCYKMFERRLYDQLEDFDQSGVERSSLTKVALEAAYLADVLSQPPQIRAGLPAILGSQGQRNVEFFDGHAGLWRISHEELHNQPLIEWAAEEDLQLARIELVDVLNLLPSPPKSNRIQTAIADLQELGCLTFHERPTALGIACLKLPTEVQLARLVILGWTMGMGPSACVLAAALSLTPSCDVFRTPIKMQVELQRHDLDLLKKCTDARSTYDEGYLSEPLLLYNIGLDWLSSGGGLGHLPRIKRADNWLLHQRLWTQFSNKVVDLWRALQRLVPISEPRTIEELRLLQAVGRGVFRRGDDPDKAKRILDNDKEKLLALVTWGVAPGGFVAVGQSPCIYGKGSYGEFWRVARENQWDVADCLYWKQSSKDARQVLRELQQKPIGLRPAEIKEVEHDEKGETTEACILYYPPDRDPNPILDRKKQEPQKLLPQDFEMLYRLCAPFNGKADIADLQKVASPVHPCAFNWYMPFRHRGGLKEVCVNWKCAAYSLLNDRRGGSRCRPKRFLVGCGGDYRNQKHGDTKARVIMLRGTSVLPSRDGGRQALLWFLSAGVPHDGQMTALCAPREGLNPKDFEIRGLWMWERTFRLPDSAIITSHDLAAVNAFRAALTHLQSHQPHRLAGRWHDEKDKEATFHIDFFTENVEEAQNDFLCVWQLNSPHPDAETKLYSVPGGWSTLQSDEQCILEELPEGKLRYGHRELSRSTEELAILEQLNPQSIQALREAANVLLEVAKDAPQRRGPLPHRLVPLCSIIEGNALAPFDLVKVEERMTTFCEALSSQGWSDMDGFQSPEEDEEMEVSDDVYLASQKNNEEYMWTLAKRETEDPDNCRYLSLPEDLLALPTAAVCAICEQSQQEGKHFSTRQLQKPIYDRLCEDCVRDKVAQEQGHTHPKAEKTILRRQ